MSGSIAGAVFSTVLDVASQIVNNVEQKNAAYEERVYNSPVGQVQRLKQAGINPYALAPQIAANNTSSAFPSAQIQFGDSVSKGIDKYSQLEARDMQRKVNDIQVQVLQEQLTSQQLDNEYKRQTLDDRSLLVKYKVKLADLDSQYRSGLITLQDYQIQRDKVLTDWQLYQAGIASDTFGDPSSTFAGGDQAPMIANANADYVANRASADLKDLDFQIRDKMRPYLEREIKFSSLKTEKDYELTAQKVIRETVAAVYEEDTNMPWNNKSMALHIIEAITGNIGKNLQQYPDVGFGRILLYSLCDYLGVPHPKAKQRKARKFW